MQRVLLYLQNREIVKELFVHGEVQCIKSLFTPLWCHSETSRGKAIRLPLHDIYDKVQIWCIKTGKSYGTFGGILTVMTDAHLVVISPFLRLVLKGFESRYGGSITGPVWEHKECLAYFPLRQNA